MPTFVGDWFPWNDVPELQDIYHTSMLALFTTWRNITYLKCPSESFEQAFDRFLQMADEHNIDMMANIQYQYACSNNMIRKRVAETADASIMGVSLDCEEQDQLYNISKHIQDAANDDAPTETFTQNDVETDWCRKSQKTSFQKSTVGILQQSHYAMLFQIRSNYWQSACLRAQRQSLLTQPILTLSSSCPTILSPTIFMLFWLAGGLDNCSCPLQGKVGLESQLCLMQSLRHLGICALHIC